MSKNKNSKDPIQDPISISVNSQTSQENLSKAELVNGKFHSEWTKETDKSMWDIIKLIWQKKPSHTRFLGIDYPNSKITHREVDYSRLSSSESSFTWVIFIFTSLFLIYNCLIQNIRLVTQLVYLS